MPPLVRLAPPRCSSTPSVAVQLQQLSAEYGASWFTRSAISDRRPLCVQRQSTRSLHTACITPAVGLPRARRPALHLSSHGICSSSSLMPHSSSAFSSSARADVGSTTSDVANSVPRFVSPTLPTHSPSFSLKKWLSHKLGYAKYRSIIRLYSSLSEQAHSDSFSHANTAAIPACPSTACALLTVHMWLLNRRLRAMASEAWQSGREADAKALHAKIRLLFNLTWQEMEQCLASVDEQADDSALPSHYAAGQHQQLAYGAMVSYDRAWAKFRETGQRHDLMGALWRNVWTTSVPLHTAQLHALTTYVEQAVQLSNRWTERDIAVGGSVQWPVLQKYEQVEASELLWYDCRLYDGSSRVGVEESAGVPLHLWESSDDDLLLVDTRKSSRRRLEGSARRTQQLPAGSNRELELSSNK